MNRTCMIAVLSLFVTMSAEVRADEVKMIRAMFSDPAKTAQPPDPKAAKSALDHIEVVAEAPSIQTDVERGLTIDVVLTNKSATTAVELRDPTGFMQVRVTDADGYPVSLRPLPTGGLSPKGASHAAQDSSTMAPRPFEIIAVDGKAIKPAKDEASSSTEAAAAPEPTPSIQLDPGKSRRLTLRVNSILADAREYHARLLRAQSAPAGDSNTVVEPPKVVSITPGTYGVKLWIALVPPTEIAGARHLETEPMTVRLEAPSK